MAQTPAQIATRFKPGSSGNPNGKPKMKSISKAIRTILDGLDEKSKKQVAEAIALAMVKRALKGDVRAAEFLAERSEGKVSDTLKLETGPRLAMSDAELAAVLLNKGSQEPEAGAEPSA